MPSIEFQFYMVALIGIKIGELVLAIIIFQFYMVALIVSSNVECVPEYLISILHGSINSVCRSGKSCSLVHFNSTW